MPEDALEERERRLKGHKGSLDDVHALMKQDFTKDIETGHGHADPVKPLLPACQASFCKPNGKVITIINCPYLLESQCSWMLRHVSGGYLWGLGTHASFWCIIREYRTCNLNEHFLAGWPQHLAKRRTWAFKQGRRARGTEQWERPLGSL